MSTAPIRQIERTMISGGQEILGSLQVFFNSLADDGIRRQETELRPTTTACRNPGLL